MTLIELKNILDLSGFPVVYSHFVETDTEPVPEPPYIAYIVLNDANLIADNALYKKIENVQIELYTNKKDLNAENTLEDLLNSNELPYSTSEFFIQTENLYQKIYEVRLI